MSPVSCTRNIEPATGRRSDDVTTTLSGSCRRFPSCAVTEQSRSVQAAFVRIQKWSAGCFPGDMASERIDFISAYCDRWCERCAFTDRCSAFACHAAIAMCGDAAEGIELAVGRPRSPEGSPDAEAGERFLEDLELPSDQEMVEIGRLEDARRARVDASAVAQTARPFMTRP